MAAVAVLDDVGVPPEVEVAPGQLVAHERVVEPPVRVWRVGDLEDEVGEALHVGAADRRAAAEEPVEGDDEAFEVGVLVERAAARVVGAGAVAAPVHRPLVRHAAQALRRHRPLQGVERRAATRAEGIVVREGHVVGVAEVPGEAVEVCEDVAGRTRRLAVARRELRVVEHRTPVAHARRLRVVDRDVRRLETRRRVHDGDRVVEARHHVEAPARFIEDEAGRATAGDGDVIRGVGDEGVVLELGRREHADCARAEGADVERRTVAADGQAERRRQAPLLHARRARDDGVVDVLVQVARLDGRAVEHRDARLVEVSADRRRRRRARNGRGEAPGPFEPDLVPRVGVADVDLPRGRVDGHVEEDRADAGEGRGLYRRRRIGVDGEDVLVGQREADGGAPVASEPVLPVPTGGIELDDEASLRPLSSLKVGVRPRQTARHDAPVGQRAGRGRRAAVADEPLGEAGRLVARLKNGRVHRAAVRRDGERARGVAEQRQEREPCAAERGAEVVRVERPDVGTSDPRRREVAQRDAAVLPAVRGRDEGPVAAGAGEHDVARLVPDEERARDPRRYGADVDDAHAVGEVVHHPHLAVGARRDRDRLEADGNGVRMRQPAGGDVEDLEPIVRRVDREQARAVRRERERPDLTALERDEGGTGRRRARDQQRDEHGQTAGERAWRHGDPLEGSTHTMPAGSRPSFFFVRRRPGLRHPSRCTGRRAGARERGTRRPSCVAT